MMYRIAAALLLPAIIYDFLTSFMGAAAFFNLQSNSQALLWGLPLVISIAAVVLNFMTYEILGDTSSSGFPKVFWFICIVYDIYTAFLGILNIKLGGGVLDFRTKNVLEAKDFLTPEDFMVLGIGAALIVASPMFAFWLLKRGKAQ